MFKKFLSKLFPGRQESGFTIVEMTVAIFIFSIVMMGVGLTFVQILNLQRRGFGAQKVQENTMFMFELMAREIRVSRIENQDSLGCTATVLFMTHPVNGNVSYTYDAINKKIIRTDVTGTSDLNSSDVQVNRFNFCISGSGVNDDHQVRIGMLMQMQNKTDQPQNTIVFDLETAVTSRDITTEYQN